MKRAVVLYNIKAGLGRVDKSMDQIMDAISKGGYTVSRKLIDFKSNPLGECLDADLLVVCGGDGTVNYVINCQKQLGLDIPLGIIPAGTANDFAGAIGMESDFVRAASQIAFGEVRNVDCGKVNGLYFINIFSFGLFTTTSQHTPDALKHAIGKLAYLIEGGKEFLGWKSIPLSIESDDTSEKTRILMMLVFNGETAGRFKIARKASYCDGVFDALYLEYCNPFVAFYNMARLLITGEPSGKVHYIRSSNFRISSTVAVETDVDGQPAPGFPVSVECLKDAVRIVHPR